MSGNIEAIAEYSVIKLRGFKEAALSRAYLKAESKKADVGYVDLAKALKKHCFKDETETSITSKLKRGAFSAAFLLATLCALEAEGIGLEDI